MIASMFICEIERRVHRGREQFRYVTWYRRSYPGTEIGVSGKWMENRSQVEADGRACMVRREREELERPAVVGRIS